MTKIDYLHMGDVVTEGLNSFILQVSINSNEDKTTGGLSVYRQNDEWKVVFSSKDAVTETITWQQFLEIFHKISVFVATENEILLKGEDE